MYFVCIFSATNRGGKRKIRLITAELAFICDLKTSPHFCCISTYNVDSPNNFQRVQYTLHLLSKFYYIFSVFLLGKNVCVWYFYAFPPLVWMDPGLMMKICSEQIIQLAHIHIHMYVLYDVHADLYH